MLDNTRLRGELTHIHRTLSVVAAGARSKDLVEDLRRSVGATTAALLWQSLFADCLRVAYGAAIADGEVGDHEIEALYEFLFSAARHYASVMPASYGEFAAVDQESARSFLERYAADDGPFGRGAKLKWPGLTLCRRAAELGEREALERYERMMTWLIEAACQIGGVTATDPRWRSRVEELAELRRTLARDAEVASSGVDRRVQAFLAPSKVFAAVSHMSSVFDADPFDVESIHADARATFEQMVERATTPSQHGDRGRMLLVLGDSGAGKTHLLRGFRRYVHEFGRGFVAYAQLHSNADDYARYLLQHVVDSLGYPYAGPSGERTGLHELASGLLRLVGEPLRSRIERLVDETWEHNTSGLAGYVHALADDLLKQADLAAFDVELLRVMLFALHPDQRVTARVYKYLRCEDMNAYDRRWVGDVAPRTDKDHPHRMICNLARFAFVTRHAALVLMVDQAELAGYDAGTGVVFRRAIDAMYRIVSEVPSAIAVVACLSDLYDEVRSGLTMSAIDRLEKDPSVERLQINRSYPQIVELVTRRLSWLFADHGAVHRMEEPVYPIPESALQGLTNRRTRDVLEWCHEFQTRCAAARRIIETDRTEAAPPPKPVAAVDADLTQIAAAWNDARHASGIEIPDEDEQILAVVGAAAKACAEETGLVLEMSPGNGLLRVQLAGASERAELAIAVTNRSYHRGSFAGQIETLRKEAGDATPIAVRTLEFPRGTGTDKVLSQLLTAGGRKAYIDASTLRALVAFQRFEPPFPASRVMAWRRRDRPVSLLPGIAEIFELDRLGPVQPAAAVSVSPIEEAAPPAVEPGTPPPRRRSSSPKTPARSTPPTGVAKLAAPSPSPPPSEPQPQPAASPPSVEPAPSPLLHAGVSTGFDAAPRTIELDSLFRHIGILGNEGIGKTTLALNLIEQALERGVAAVLVDRKGDLAGYARPDWWKAAADPARARRLAERIDVRLFTPGTRGGRPLSVSVIPDLEHVPEQDRERMVQYAARALGAMMGLDGAAGTTKRAILTQAIAVLAGRNPTGGIPELIALLERQDAELLARANRYDEKQFKSLVQELEAVQSSHAELLDASAEPLSGETLIGLGPDGKVPLAIVSTRFLGEDEQVQAWSSYLLASLSCHLASSSSTDLRTLLLIDQADLFMPAGAAKPPSKEPLQDLLKRTGTGLGILLASHSPAEFDYRSRDQIHTWFLGRIADKRAVDKMKPILGERFTIRGKLSTLETRRFVMLQDGGLADLERAPSLLRTEPLAEAELISLAAPARPRPRRGARA